MAGSARGGSDVMNPASQYSATLRRRGLSSSARTTATTVTGLGLVYAFILSLALPVEASVFIGPMRLSPYRIVLLISIIPILYRFMSGRAGGFRWVDGILVLHVLWAMLAVFYIHGVSAWELSGIYAIEVLVPYFLARSYIRTADDFEAFVRFALWVLAFLLPIFAFEAFGGAYLRNVDQQMAARWGLYRAYGPFEHPILAGVFCASLFGIVFYTFKTKAMATRRFMATGLVLATTFFSLSAGPYVAVAAQGGLLIWNRMAARLKHRWAVLAGLSAMAWIVVDLISNRTPIHVFITYFTFNMGTAYHRILIWEYGSAEVVRNPWFGIGFHDWQRPAWMTASMDNLWLVEAVRYGLPAFLLLVLVIVVLCTKVGLRRGLDQHSANCRTGWLVSVVGLVIAGCTVHYWNATFVFFLFLIGCGGWFIWPDRPATATRRSLKHSRDTTRAAAATPRARPLPRRSQRYGA